LNDTTEVAEVTVNDRRFHTCAAVTLKARSLTVRSRVHGTISRWVQPDHGCWGHSDSSVHRKSLARYGRARFWQQCKMSMASRFRTHSQCRSWSRYLTWSCFRTSHTKDATAFRMDPADCSGKNL